MKIRSKAPLRLGIAGGGTDVSPYSDKYGGAVLNSTINLYAYTFLEEHAEENSLFIAEDIGVTDKIYLSNRIQLEGRLLLHRAVYKRVMEQFNGGQYMPLKIITFCDAPPGSGLGSSSALVVSMLEAYRELLYLPLGEYDLAKLAYEIERNDCNLSGGKQDQYAAAFGGFNFIEFGANDLVVVNPLRVRPRIVNELELSTVLFFTGASRDSAKIIDDQIDSLKKNGTPLLAMHKVKDSAYKLKAFLLKGGIGDLALELKSSWAAKKATSTSISNKVISEIEGEVLKAGAISMKVSGAGGGGFIMVMVAPETRQKVVKALKNFEGLVVDFEFTEGGVVSWRI
jgi:D-glycero-alpha-D-manno-heptose-7-phosphate kinase